MNYVESIHVGENVHDVLMRLRYSTDMTNYYGYRPNKKAVDALLIIPGYVVCICSFVIVFLDDRSYDLIRMFRVKKGRIVEEVNLLSLKHNMELDILPQGSHWEGDILGQNPCGWGSLYNSDNYLLYRGCMILSSRCVMARITIRQSTPHYGMLVAGLRINEWGMAAFMTYMGTCFQKEIG